jgi:hypothetical protein
MTRATVFYAHEQHEVATDEALTFGRSTAYTICLDPADRGSPAGRALSSRQ